MPKKAVKLIEFLNSDGEPIGTREAAVVPGARCLSENYAVSHSGGDVYQADYLGMYYQMCGAHLTCSPYVRWKEANDTQ